MVQTITIPFSELNKIPAVSGVDDVTFDIPELSDIEDAIEDLIVTSTAIQATFSEAVQDAGADLASDFAEARDFTDSVADAVVSEFSRRVQESGEFLQGIGQQLIDDLEASDQGLPVDLDGDDLSISIGPGDIGLDVDALADDIADQLDVSAGDDTTVSFESVFGAQATTITQAFEDAIDEKIGDSLDLPDEFTSIGSAIQDIKEDLDDLEIPTAEEIADEIDPLEFGDDVVGLVEDLATAPAEFVADAITEAIESAVSEETKEDYRDLAELFE